MTNPEIAASRAWEAITLGFVESGDWAGQQFAALVQVARQHPELTRLFPYKSLNTLCFSQCSEYRYTTDLPCIGFTQQSFVVLADSQVRDEVATPVLSGELETAEQAVSYLLSSLPADVAVWVGSDKDRPA